MILYPAIDLKDGACVRLLRGDMDQATHFHDDPTEPARRFAAAGAEWLHLVDLNGAFEGAPVNAAPVEAILAATRLKVQLGGGVRTRAQIDAWFDKGVARLVLGTAAVRDPALVHEACRAYPGRIAVGLDARDGRIAIQGWAETTEISAAELAHRFEDAGVAALIYTDIERDGAMEGPNIDATVELARTSTIPVIASGGVSGMDDLRALKTASEGVALNGVIVGRALYDGSVEPAAAVAALRGPDAGAAEPKEPDAC